MVIGWDIGGVNTKAARVSAGRIASGVGDPEDVELESEVLRTGA